MEKLEKKLRKLIGKYGTQSVINTLGPIIDEIENKECACEGCTGAHGIPDPPTVVDDSTMGSVTTGGSKNFAVGFPGIITPLTPPDIDGEQERVQVFPGDKIVIQSLPGMYNVVQCEEDGGVWLAHDGDKPELLQFPFTYAIKVVARASELKGENE